MYQNHMSMKHLMKSSYVVLFVVVTFVALISCSDSNNALLKSVDKGLRDANFSIYVNTESRLHSLEDKTKDSATVRRASLLYPKALEIQTITKGYYDYLDSLKSLMVDQSGNPLKIRAEELENRFYSFYARLLSVSPQLDSAFRQTLYSGEYFDSVNPKSRYIAGVFTNTSGVETTVMLTNFQQMARTIESRMVYFFESRMTTAGCVWDPYFALVTQNSTVVQEGETIEITAGLGTYSRDGKPVIIIDGKELSVGESGLARYTIKAGKRGKHKVRVQINYIDGYSGEPVATTKQIEYTVR